MHTPSVHNLLKDKQFKLKESTHFLQVFFKDHGHFDASGFSICDSKEIRLSRIRNLTGEGMTACLCIWTCPTRQVHNFYVHHFLVKELEELNKSNLETIVNLRHFHV